MTALAPLVRAGDDLIPAESLRDPRTFGEEIATSRDLRASLAAWIQAFVAQYEREIVEYNMWTVLPNEANAFAEVINAALRDPAVPTETKIILVESLVDFVIGYGKVDDRVGFMNGYHAADARLPFAGQNFEFWFSALSELSGQPEFEGVFRDAAAKLTHHLRELLVLGHYHHKQRAIAREWRNTESKEWDRAEAKRSLDLVRTSFQLANLFNSPQMILATYQLSQFHLPETDELDWELSSLRSAIASGLRRVESSFPTAYGEHVMANLRDGKPVLAIPAGSTAQDTANEVQRHCESLLADTTLRLPSGE